MKNWKQIKEENKKRVAQGKPRKPETLAEYDSYFKVQERIEDELANFARVFYENQEKKKMALMAENTEEEEDGFQQNHDPSNPFVFN